MSLGYENAGVLVQTVLRFRFLAFDFGGGQPKPQSKIQASLLPGKTKSALNAGDAKVPYDLYGDCVLSL
eukprot:297841-Rhodomonas_salina.7